MAKTITKAEHERLVALKADGYSYLARDADRKLYAFKDSEIKKSERGMWKGARTVPQKVNMLLFCELVTKDDAQPTEIDILLSLPRCKGAGRPPSKTKSPDVVENPAHYKGLKGLEAIEVVRNFSSIEQQEGFYLGNTLKYLLRYQNKNGMEDLLKAQKNLEWLISLMADKTAKPTE